MPFSAQEQTHAPVTGGGVSPYNAQSGVMLYDKVLAKTADYTVLDSDFGTIFTNRGCTAKVSFTLPAITSIPVGWWAIFYSVDNDGIAVLSAGSNDNIIAKNDAGADSITMSTNSLSIGCSVKMIWDGTSWLSFQGASGGTYTVA